MSLFKKKKQPKKPTKVKSTKSKPIAKKPVEAKTTKKAKPTKIKQPAEKYSKPVKAKQAAKPTKATKPAKKPVLKHDSKFEIGTDGDKPILINVNKSRNIQPPKATAKSRVRVKSIRVHYEFKD